ncbi:hypothetical protein [Micromonospora arborensis]|uniref:hypothetical protein n=1 Tax=Micromonospora arborensis TaxID=2116518 RepID=UPI00371591BC
MSGVSAAVNELAEAFGLVVDWGSFDQLMTTDPATYFHITSLASVRSFSRSLIAHHQPVINEALDHAKGTAGLDDEALAFWASAFFTINVEQSDEEQAAMAEARPLVEKLVAAGIWRRRDGDVDQVVS